METQVKVDEKDESRHLIADQEIPSLPAVVAEILEVLRGERSDIDDLADLLAHDVNLSVRVLSLARSPLFANAVPPTTLRDAVRRLGFDRVGEIVTTAAIGGLLSRTSPALDGLWKHSISVAVLSADLASVCRLGESSGAYLIGLCHDLGFLAMVGALEAEGLTVASAEGPRILDDRLDAISAEHQAVGSKMLADWGMPDLVVEGARSHHAAADLVGAHHDLRIVGLANRLISHPVDEDVVEWMQLVPEIPDSVDLVERIVSAEQSVELVISLFGG